MLLLVDDEDSIRTMLLDVLDLIGFEADVCGDGETAVAYYRNCWEDTELVILDLSLPSMSGVEAFHNMQRINPEMKVIFMSGYDMKREVEQYLQSGRRTFLQKPFSIPQIRDAIMDLLEPNCVSG